MAEASATPPPPSFDPLAPTAAATPGATSSAAPSAMHGWAMLQRFVNRTLPAQLSHAEAIRQQTLRVLGD